jgi:hypothetical protein
MNSAKHFYLRIGESNRLFEPAPPAEPSIDFWHEAPLPLAELVNAATMASASAAISL